MPSLNYQLTAALNSMKISRTRWHPRLLDQAKILDKTATHFQLWALLDIDQIPFKPNPVSRTDNRLICKVQIR